MTYGGLRGAVSLVTGARLKIGKKGGGEHFDEAQRRAAAAAYGRVGALYEYASLSSQLAAVRAQLDGARGVSFRERGWGSLGDFWGDYEHHSTHQGWHGADHEGWPVLKNANGMYLYYHQPKKRWFLRNQCLPEQDGAAVFFDAPEGPLPVGAHIWKCWIDREWVDRTLTVALVTA